MILRLGWCKICLKYDCYYLKHRIEYTEVIKYKKEIAKVDKV